ncbi:hypothetical protein KC353_g2620 [Hortaea werneckii]|uniref:Glutamate--tRNA ligase, mitochondrial n=1 Tax=Hortaea werneckii TaxID=91943 RepID=A0A3M7BWR6_HORWE|nr:hypothetical protein KC353_g2620 [Hortaea werneckii]RMY44312.1 hypothetical protein D0865_10643 [Hortaea werneckii]
MSALRPPQLYRQARKGWVCQSCLRRSLEASRRGFTAVARNGARLDQYRLKTLPLQRSNRAANIKAFASSSRSHAAPSRKPILPDGPARTRFAPSPTGHLHIGGLRTALFSYLLARRTAGQFLLRIEDTDQRRLVPGAEQRLLDDLRWAGVEWDEGPVVGGPHGPYKQSERNDIYQHHARELLNSEAAYRCFCTPQTAGQGTAAYVTSGCYQDCASLPSEQAQEKAEKNDPFTVRLRLPSPHEAKKRVYPDLIYGKITPLKRSPTAVAASASAAAAEGGDSGGIDAADTILVKSDGTPTYHFANVVDDHLMNITHVIRGTEWMASTPLHYDLYHAFGWKPPAFAHVGLLVDENKAKLSKRNSDLALDITSMRDELGVLPQTLVNFLTLLGWSNPTRDDVMDLKELIQNFDLKFTKGNTMVRTEKLWYLQKHHVARLCQGVLNEEPGSHESLLAVAQSVALEVTATYPSFEKSLASEYEARSNEAYRISTTDQTPPTTPNLKIRTQFLGRPFHGLGDTSPRLTLYCYNLLQADSKSYQTAAQYVTRNRYFFDFDPAEVPPVPETYGKERTIPRQQIEALTHKFLTFDFARLASDPSGEARTALLEGNKPGESQALLPPWFEIDAMRIHAALDAVTDGDKEVKNAMMKFLRMKLAYGLPGPSIGVVMAVLGWRESCRRLGVQVVEGEEEEEGGVRGGEGVLKSVE